MTRPSEQVEADLRRYEYAGRLAPWPELVREAADTIKGGQKKVEALVREVDHWREVAARLEGLTVEEMDELYPVPEEES